MEKNNRTKYEFKNEAQRAVLKIYDYVGKWEEVNTESIENQLNDAGEKPLDIYINSYGGEVFEGFAIYNILNRYKGKKTVYVDGIAASIASVIALVGDKVVMNKLSMLMIHNASSWCWGTAEEMMKTANSLLQINGVIRSLYKEKTNLSEEQIKDYMDQEKFFTAEECLEFGFCDEVAEAEIDKDTTLNAMNMIRDGVEDRINMLNKLKKAGFINAATDDESRKEKNTAFFDTKKALCSWLKGE